MTGSVLHVLYAGIAFVGIHMVSSTPLRGRVVAGIGEAGFQGVFSLLSALALGWLIWAYGAAPREAVWAPSLWARHIPLAVMPVALILVVAGLATPNPTMAGAGRSLKTGDPAPGVLKITRHPMMWGIALWALSHIPPNGDRASIVFFGALGLLALAGMPLIDRKTAARMGADWGPFALRTSAVPFLAALQGRTRISWREIGWWRPALGLAAYAAFLFGHRHVIGASPWPS